ncbi:hypothetical protein GIB67_013492 [Kingdonia uniflora]|uniref:DUF4283 domain-containing protein n=1 Tax=Kingdonia uniflora TaxID=39325 RepID=A0A7J7LR61_9MAGN|nr:hypothetical protein GIB67_013492 [Kingdonia uniflora]
MSMMASTSQVFVLEVSKKQPCRSSSKGGKKKSQSIRGGRKPKIDKRTKTLFRKRARQYNSDDEGENGSDAPDDVFGEKGGSEDEGDEIQPGITKFSEGVRVFSVAFNAITRKNIPDVALGPVLSGHMKLVAEKLAEEKETDRKLKGEAKKHKYLVRYLRNIYDLVYLEDEATRLMKLANELNTSEASPNNDSSMVSLEDAIDDEARSLDHEHEDDDANTQSVDKIDYKMLELALWEKLREIQNSKSVEDSAAVSATEELSAREPAIGQVSFSTVEEFPVLPSTNKTYENNLEMNTLGDNSSKPSWAQMLGAPSTSRSKANLIYTPPTLIRGIGTAKMNSSNFKDYIKNSESIVVGNFIGKRLPYKYLKDSLSKVWGLKSDFEMTLKRNNNYFFRFGNDEDRERVLEMGYFHLASRMFILRPWRPFIEFEPTEVSSIPI